MTGLDVAVIELVGGDAPEACAAALRREAGPAGATVRVERRQGGADGVPARRARAAARGEAPCLLLVEDTTRLAPGWLAALGAAFADPAVAAAWGPVAVDPGLPARFRALGRLEYGRFDGAREASGPPGNALAVRRADLRAALGPSPAGIVEHDLAARLISRGRAVRRVPGFRASYALPDPFGARLATRFGHGRLYGSGREGGRAAGALKALLAPPVLALRGARAARAAGPWLPELPWILAMSVAWGAGELAGQILGPGRSGESWT